VFHRVQGSGFRVQLRLDRWRLIVPVIAGLITAGGCSFKRFAIDSYPPGCLHVRYHPAGGHSSCLLAAVIMAANYVDGRERFSEPDALRAIRAEKGDESRVSDVTDWFHRTQDELALFVLQGSLSGQPPTGLPYWLLDRGYPVVCVINKTGRNADYNHAVVVIGLAPASAASVERVHYLDPAALERVESCDRATFETYWSRGQNTMALVVPRPNGRTAQSVMR